MAGHSLWEAVASSGSPTPHPRPGSHATPQAARASSRFFFNPSPGWNIAESSSQSNKQNSRRSNVKPAANPNLDAPFAKASNLHKIFDMSPPNDLLPHLHPSAEDSTAQDFLTRYQQLKSLDGHKNELIEELLYRYEFLSEQFRKMSDEHDRAREYNRTSHCREKSLQEDVRRLQVHLERDPFILLLIDGRDIIFQSQFLQKGEAGGYEAATLLHEKIRTHLSNSMPDLLPGTRIVTRVYADVKGLGEILHKAGIVDRPSKVEEFARGFNEGKGLFDFVDVGSGKDVIDVKLAELFNLHLYDYRCRQIFIGSSWSKNSFRLLQELSTNQHIQDRVTLLEGIPFEQDSTRFDHATVKFDCLFRDTKIHLYEQDSPQGSGICSSTHGVSLPSFSPAGSALSCRPSEVDLKHARDLIDRPPPARAASTSTDSARPSPVLTWASAVAKPAIPSITPPTRSASIAQLSASKDRIARNRKGQRVDPIMKHDKTEVDRVKKLKMCNVHFLRGECPYGDSCSHVHQYKPTAGELQTLRLVARMAPCMHGTDCDEAKCIYGHACPAPEGRDGKDCIFGDQCRFPTEMHKIDRQIVRTVKV